MRAVINPTGTVGPIIGRLSSGIYTLVYTDAMLAELLDVLEGNPDREPFDLPRAAR